MVDVTQICNQALAAVGTRTSITSLAEKSNEARQCLLQYDATRRYLLRSAHWGFARAYTKPALLRARYGTPEASPLQPPPTSSWNTLWEPPPPWLYSYALPSFLLAVRYVLPGSPSGQPTVPFFGTPTSTMYPVFGSGPMPKFEMAQDNLPGQPVIPGMFGPFNAILTNEAQAIICYTADVEDVLRFDESFVRALVQGLAANICQALTGDIKLFDALIKTTNSFVMEARVKSANEALNVFDTMPDWFRVRGSGPSIGTGPWIPEYGPLFGGGV